MEGTAIIGLDERKTKCVLMFHDINDWKKEKKNMHEWQCVKTKVGKWDKLNKKKSKKKKIL